VKRLPFILLCMTAAAALAAAQTPSTVASLVQRGLEGNLDLARAREALKTAQEALPWKSQLSSTKATLSGSYDVSGAEGTSKADASVTVPVVPQVSLGASVSSQGSAGATLSVSPFAAGVTRYQETAAYENARADLAYQTASLGYQIESAAYGVLQAQAALDTARGRHALEERALGIAEQSYSLDGISWEDLEQARTDLNDARQAAFDAERAHLSARVKLYQLVGPSGAEPSVASVAFEDLQAAIVGRDAAVAETTARTAATLALAKARTALQALQGQLAATPTYRPNVSLGARLTYGFQPSTISASGSLSFSFSPNDVQTDERKDIQVSIQAKEHELAFEGLSATFQTDVAARALEVSRAALDGRTTGLRQARLTLEEAELLFEQGERTEIEVEETRLAVRSAENALLSAAEAVLAAQADILLLHVL
jgi:outer membrane protein TolC